MNSSNEIINRVEKIGLVQIDLQEMVHPAPRYTIELEDLLYEGQVLRERDFRSFILSHDWNRYINAFVNVQCSADAIIPTWAFMLVSVALQNKALDVVMGTREELESLIWNRVMETMDVTPYRGKRVVVKGCSRLPAERTAYTALTCKLIPVVNALMYGEPCSTVPVYRKNEG